MERDYKLDGIRIFSALLIFLCHIFLIHGFYGIAFWLNNGVQLFFILSAYLLSKYSFERKQDILVFYRNRLVKIMVPYWIYLSMVLLVLFVIQQEVRLDAIILYAIGMAGFSQHSVLGLGHFWYISVLLFCYLLAPVLDLVDRKCALKSHALRMFVQIAVIAWIILCFYLVGKTPYGFYVGLFAGTFFFFKQNGSLCCLKRGVKIWFIPALLFAAARIYLESQDFLRGGVLVQAYEDWFLPPARCIIGIFLFCLLYQIMPSRRIRSISYLSGISYEIYLVHQFIELSVDRFIPYCASNGIPNMLVYIVICAGLTLINAVVLKKMVGFVLKCQT